LSIHQFLSTRAWGALYLNVGHREAPKYNGFFVRTTNAQLTWSESTRWDSAFRANAATPIRSVGEQRSHDIDGLLLKDTKLHILAISQGPKSWGGYRYILTRYDGTAPRSIVEADLSKFSIAGLKVGDSNYSMFLHFGEPYGIEMLINDEQIGLMRPHILGRPSWFTTDLGGGVYDYVGAVPNKSQSCVTSYQLVIRSKHIRAIIASTEC
jgi:hypothetical protein